jgi:class 3 adenylate cyclase/DNA-binding CsgD family transcriptional regulator
MAARELPTGTVTFLFSDVEGSTRLLRRLGERYGEALSEHRRLLREAFAAHAGVEVDTQGDAFFVAFRRAKDAVLAAAEAQGALAAHQWPADAALRVRIGLHTGEPRVRDQGYDGLSVHRAARVCATGSGGQVVLSSSTRALLVDEDVELRELGERRLKDFELPERLYELVLETPAAPIAPEPEPPAPPQSPHLVGREDELARLPPFLTKARAAPAALLIEGEAGIGKTTLWRAAVARAREQGFRVLSARPAEAERELAFAALGDLLADSHEEIRALPPQYRRPLEAALLLADESAGPPTEPRAIAVGLLAVLRALGARGPLLVAIDDVQWIDAASATALAFALRRAAEQPLAILLARRSGLEVALPLALEQSLVLDRISLAPLSLGALGRILRETLGTSFSRPLVRKLHERSGGNPFFALELARALEARRGEVAPGDELPVPDDLKRLLAARLELLAGETRESLAALAARAEPRFEDVVADEALEPAFAAGVIRLEGERLRFAHPLLAAAAYEALTPQRRRTLHRRLADASENVEQRARHLALATVGTDPDLAALLDAAAASARTRGAPEIAAELAEAALRFGDPDDDDLYARRVAVAMEHNFVAGNFGRARALLDDALAKPLAASARARLLARGLHHDPSLVSDGDARIAEWQEALNATDDAAVRAQILTDLAYTHAWQRNVAAAAPYAEAALEAAEEAGDHGMLAAALCSAATSRFNLGRGAPADLMARALEVDAACGSVPIADRPLTQVGWITKWSGDIDSARPLLERAIEIGVERDDSSVLIPLFYSTALEFLAENWQRGLELTDAVYEVGIESGRPWVVCTRLVVRSLFLAHLGDEEGARRCESDALETGEDIEVNPILQSALSVLDLSLDAPGLALARARRTTEERRAAGIAEPALLWSFPIHAEAAIAVGELEEAEELLDWIEPIATRLDRAWALACAARCRGLLAAARGDEASALADFERALAEHERVQYRRFDRARTLLAQGRTLRRFKHKRTAREAIEAALAIFEELGAKLWAENARRELARIGGRRRSEGLTETEQRVAELVAAGRSNKEVAGELYVTVRTVETNLTKIYAKLGIRSRTELARRLSA